MAAMALARPRPAAVAASARCCARSCAATCRASSARSSRPSARATATWRAGPSRRSATALLPLLGAGAGAGAGSRRLIVNLPPRSLKSLIVSVARPAWVLGHDPSGSDGARHRRGCGAGISALLLLLGVALLFRAPRLGNPVRGRQATLPPGRRPDATRVAALRGRLGPQAGRAGPGVCGDPAAGGRRHLAVPARGDPVRWRNRLRGEQDRRQFAPRGRPSWRTSPN